MMILSNIIFPFLFSTVGFAEKLILPPSLSYQTMTQCFPELIDSEQFQKINLERVKNQIDILYATEKKTLSSRIVKFQMPSGEQRRLKYFREQRQGQWGYALELAKVTEAQGYESLPVAKSQLWNAPQETLRKYFEMGKILSDEESFLVAKTGGNELLLEVIDGMVRKLQLTRNSSKKSLNCSSQKGSLVICLCRTL